MEKSSNVKKTTLRKLLVAVFAVAILCPLAKAQTIGGDDLKVIEFNNDIPVKSKTVVADNGWIYLMVHSGFDTDNSNVKIFRSKDDGATYEKLRDWSPGGDNYRYQDFDIVVTGKDESDIKVWSVELMNKPGTYESRVDVFCRDANLQNTVHPYHEDFSIVRLYDVAIATNYRAPSASGKGGNPFALAFAYTGFNSTNTQSFVDYVYSLDGGQTFTKNLLFVQDGEEKIDKVDLSLGSTSATMGHSTWPLMGVVFEMNKKVGKSDIGFLSNFVDNPLNYKWTDPITVSVGNLSYSPKIQMLLDEDNNTINGEQCHNFMITYSNYDSGNLNWDIRYVRPKTSFKYIVGHTPAMGDMEEGLLISSPQDETNSGLGYDKGANHYLITYAQKEGSGTNTLKYFWVNYNDIHTDFSSINQYTYTSSANALYTPQVDVSPTKNRVCWSWTESESGKQTVWTDTEWNTSSDVEEVTVTQSIVQLSPNQAKDYIVICLPTEADYKATLHDTQGRTLTTFAFSGKEYKLSLQDFAKGVYLLRITTPKGEIYNCRFVIE